MALICLGHWGWWRRIVGFQLGITVLTSRWLSLFNSHRCDASCMLRPTLSSSDYVTSCLHGMLLFAIFLNSSSRLPRRARRRETGRADIQGIDWWLKTFHFNAFMINLQLPLDYILVGNLRWISWHHTWWTLSTRSEHSENRWCSAVTPSDLLGGNLHMAVDCRSLF